VQLPVLPTTTYDWNIAATDTIAQATLGVIAVPGDPGDARAILLGPAGEAELEIGAAGVVSSATYVATPPAVVRTRLPFLPR
jgi:hypothetical protein